MSPTIKKITTPLSDEVIKSLNVAMSFTSQGLFTQRGMRLISNWWN
jgi:hypothetical protein